jgi:hypothetical protein
LNLRLNLRLQDLENSLAKERERAARYKQEAHTMQAAVKRNRAMNAQLASDKVRAVTNKFSTTAAFPLCHYATCCC